MDEYTIIKYRLLIKKNG